MRLMRIPLLAGACLLVSGAAVARDDIGTYAIAGVLSNPAYAARLEGVTFYFGEQAYPAVEKKLGEYMSNKKTNAVGKSDQEACEWAFLSALLSFRDRALSLGGNAVVNIRGWYKKNAYTSTTEFQCGAGATMAGVTLKGDVVKLK